MVCDDIASASAASQKEGKESWWEQAGRLRKRVRLACLDLIQKRGCNVRVLVDDALALSQFWQRAHCLHQTLSESAGEDSMQRGISETPTPLGDRLRRAEPSIP